MTTFKEMEANTIYRVTRSNYSSNWSDYPDGYYMTLDTMEAVRTPKSYKTAVYQVDDNGEFVRDEDGYKVEQLDDNGETVKEFAYSYSAKKGSIWMIKIPAADIKTVGIYETKTFVEDEEYWDDPNVPETYTERVQVGTKLTRKVGERPELDLDDLHLVQTRHVDWKYGTDLDALYQSREEYYLETQAADAARDLKIVTNKGKIAKLSQATWALFLDEYGDKLFFYGDEDGNERNRFYYEDGTPSRYGPQISYGTLFAVDELIKDLEYNKEEAEYAKEKLSASRKVIDDLEDQVQSLEAQITLMEVKASGE